MNPEIGSKAVKGAGRVSCEEQLRALGFSCLERRRLRGNLTGLCSFLRRTRREGGDDFFLGFGARVHWNASKLHPSAEVS